MNETLDRLSINTIRALSIDAVQKANSGHPGLPLGAAVMGYALYNDFMKYNPADPDWINRDRFVLSAGHGCALLYSLLHLTGYELSIEELKQFRQWGSLTPGHPESHLTPGVEATTGPLGQGVGNIIGMAIAREHLAAMFGKELINFRVFGICSDGDLMEGVSGEASSLAGHLGLGAITLLYDDNNITIDGRTTLAFTEDVGKRYEAYGWHVISVDGMDLSAVRLAIQAGINETTRPTLIRCKTTIGFGSPNKADTSKVHGSPLGEEELALTKKNLGVPEDKSFYVPQEVFKHMRLALQRGEAWQKEWNSVLENAWKQSSEFKENWKNFWERKYPANWADKLPSWSAKDKPIATRKASEAVINAMAPTMPWLFGGSADLAESNLNYMKGLGDFQKDNHGGRNLRFGVREHGMGAILNGIALTAPFAAFGATFLSFLDYMKPSVRLAAISELPVIYIFTHDSIGLGEDGPTHQPIEHLTHMRATPNLWTMRPADPNETAACWQIAVERRDGPCALSLTRQSVPILDAETFGRLQVDKGAYVLSDAKNGLPDIILISTGSEVGLILKAKELLEKDGHAVRVVSAPCLELFDLQPDSYRKKVLPPECVNRVAVEAGATLGWWKYVGTHGDIIGLDGYGASAPAEIIYEKLGLTPENITKRASELCERNAMHGAVQ